jgi:predicted DCC family thiol-disulfide oxidoreductase YuxK
MASQPEIESAPEPAPESRADGSPAAKPSPKPAAKPAAAAWGERASDWFRKHYLAVDPRWLGVFRIVFGSLLFADGARRWYYARAFYSNDGILPNHFSLFRPMGRHVFSLYHAFSTMGEVSVAFALTLFVFAMFLIGFKTKLFHILSAVCITGLNARNIFVENGGTVVVNLLVVWTLFLPLGRRLSVDAVLASLRARKEQTSAELNDRTNPPRDDTPYVSLVVLGLMLQWSVIYFLNCVHKDGQGWMNGSTLHWFWHQDRIATWLAIFAREHAPFWLVRGLTYGTLIVEAILAFILLIPFGQVWTRRIALLLAAGLHGGIAASSRLGPFSYAMTMFFLLLLGERDWQLLSRWFGRPGRVRTIVYDSDCGICLLICRILKRLDVFERLRFIGNHERELLPAGVDPTILDKTAVVVDAKGRVFIEERVMLEAIRALPLGIVFVWWLWIPGIAQIARIGYRKFAANRMQVSAWFGLGICGVEPPPRAAPESPPAPAETPPAEPPVAAATPPAEPSAVAKPAEAPRNLRDDLRGVGGFVREAAVAVLILTLATQVAIENNWMRRHFRVRQPEWMSVIVEYPRLFEGWGMFAPEPPYDDGRIIVDGRTADGRKLDPLTGKEPEFDPYTPTGWGHQQFWCDYHNRIRFSGHAGNRQHLKNYLLNVHRWGGRPQDALVAFDVWWVHDRSPPPGQLRGAPMPPEKLLSHGFVSDSGAGPWLNRVAQ